MEANQDSDDPARMNSNFYEIAWRARAEVFNDFLAQTGNYLWESLKRFLSFENQHFFKINIKGVVNPETGETVQIADGGYKFEPNPSLKQNPHVPLRDLAVLLAGEQANDVPEAVPQSHVPPWIVSALARQDFDAIVELGCGYGRRLFEIHYECGHKSARLFGGEYTNAGCLLTKELAALDDGVDLTAFKFDHLNPDLSTIPGFGKVLIFSCHSIEQCEAIPEDYFEALAGKAGHVTGVHFEPFGFQASRRLPGAAKHEDFTHRHKYNQNFFETARRAHEKGVIHIHWMALDLLKFQPTNPTSLLILTKDNTG